MGKRLPTAIRPLDAARQALLIEAEALAGLVDRVDDQFAAAVELLDNTTGRVVVTGIGKSGHVGRKLAATLASTMVPALFVHAGEALHGDAGMIIEGDALLAISASGETPEVCTFVVLARERAIPVVAMVGSPSCRLRELADAVVDVSIEREADPLNLAPTASSVVTAAMGDALTAALMVRRGCDVADFAARHPGGSLGARLGAETIG